MSDEEDSDFDGDEMIKELEGMKNLLQRHVGKHRNVASLQETEGHWPEVHGINKEQIATVAETVALVNDAEENERKRRMSGVPFAETFTDDFDIEESSEHVATMHEELLHLFAVHDAKFQAKCEKERRTAEAVKQRVQEQLLTKIRLRKARQVFEEERQRKIQQMESFVTGESEESLALAETNERLSVVHEDLKNAFHIMQKVREKKEMDELLVAEEHKEMLIQDIRRRSTKRQLEKDFELARKEKIYEFNKRQTSSEAENLDKSLVKVQEDLLKLFGKLKKERKVKKEETRLEQRNLKTEMQEELLHKTLGKQVSELEAQEKARRINEAKNVTEEDSKRQKTMDMLIGVQKQLLDVMAHTELTSTKQQMQQLKFMNARTSMLHEIRSLRGSSQCIERKAYRPGRRLSIIGENLQK